jgi:hypothetical protein
MFSIMTIASSTTKPVAIVSAISVRLLIENPARYMTRERADERERHRDGRDQRRAEAAQEHEDHEHDEHDREQSSTCTSSTEARIVIVRSVSSARRPRPAARP